MGIFPNSVPVIDNSCEGSRSTAKDSSSRYRHIFLEASSAAYDAKRNMPFSGKTLTRCVLKLNLRPCLFVILTSRSFLFFWINCFVSTADLDNEWYLTQTICYSHYARIFVRNYNLKMRTACELLNTLVCWTRSIGTVKWRKQELRYTGAVMYLFLGCSKQVCVLLKAPVLC